MVDPSKIIARVRANGANVTVANGKLNIVNSNKLPDGALDYIKLHGKDIAEFIRREAATQQRVATGNHESLSQATVETVTRLLFTAAPEDVIPADWTWFVSKAAQIMDDAVLREVA